MNQERYIPPPELREQLRQNMRLAVEASAEVDRKLDELIALLDEQILNSPAEKRNATRKVS